MSSYPQNVSSIESPWTEEELNQTYLCHECGKEAVRLVRNDYVLMDGTIIPDLERLQCASCGANMFDLAAMRRIREVRSSQTKHRTRRRTIRKRIVESTNA